MVFIDLLLLCLYIHSRICIYIYISESGISPLEAIFNSNLPYEGPSHDMNPGLEDSIRYVTNAAFYPGDADHTLLDSLCKFGWNSLLIPVSIIWSLEWCLSVLSCVRLFIFYLWYLAHVYMHIFISVMCTLCFIMYIYVFSSLWRFGNKQIIIICVYTPTVQYSCPHRIVWSYCFKYVHHIWYIHRK